MTGPRRRHRTDWVRRLSRSGRSVASMDGETAYGVTAHWQPVKPKLRPLRLVVAWLVGAASVGIAAWVVEGVALSDPAGAFIAAFLIAVLNALLPPVIAALRLPLALLSGFVAVLIADAAVLRIAADIAPDHIRVDSFGSALLAALLIAAASVVLQVIIGSNDD